MSRTLFLIGAGFNVDAVHKVTTAVCIGDYCYPLLPDTLKLCFGLDQIPAGKSIEDLFSAAIGRRCYFPVDKLRERLMGADYHVAWPLAFSNESNYYRHFFEASTGSDFLTFNYDSLAEIFLFKLNRWYPHDGYGVPVEVVLPPHKAQFADQTSTSRVLHLHGTFCLYTSDHVWRCNLDGFIAWFKQCERPRYVFDPDLISSLFGPYVCPSRRPGYDPVEGRVIAPIPDKAQGLKKAFISETYKKADELVREAGTLVAIGYSFNAHDRASYDPILQALAESPNRRLLVVSPDAYETVTRLGREYGRLNIEPIKTTFKGWAEASFRGLGEGRAR